MRLISLSDHVGDTLAAGRRQREQADQQAADRYQRLLASHRGWVAEAGQERDRAWAQRRLLAWLRWWLEAGNRQRTPEPRPPGRLPVSADEAKWKSGADGEQGVAEVLDGVLGGDWIAVKGYARGRNDIDYLILGPAGLFAVEVKNVTGTITITRDQWRRVKTDRYEIQHDKGVVADRGQRPPHVQVSESAGELERFLASRGHPVRLHPVVLLTHPAVRVRIEEDPGVPVLTSAEQFARMALTAGGNFSEGQLTQITSLVKGHHRPAGSAGRIDRRASGNGGRPGS